MTKTVMKFVVCLRPFLLTGFSVGAQGPREFPLNSAFKGRMTAEGAFASSLRTAQRWCFDMNRLIIEGEAVQLLLAASRK